MTTIIHHLIESVKPNPASKTTQASPINLHGHTPTGIRARTGLRAGTLTHQDDPKSKGEGKLICC